MTSLVSVGDNCVDVYLTWGCATVGGNALNVAANWRRRGLPTRYLGAVGEDAEGEIVRNGVTAAGLDPAHLQRLPGDTGVTLLSHENGDRHFLLEHFGVSFRYLPPDPAYCTLHDADWVHLGTSTSTELIGRLAGDQMPFSVDVSTSYDSLPLDGVPLTFASCPEDSAWTAESVADTLRDMGARQVVVTRGRLGAHFYGDAPPVYVPVPAVDVVDTCGAGDSFIAEFVLSFCLGAVRPVEALHRAAVAAAATCGHVGGFPQPLRPVPERLAEAAYEVTARDD